MRYLPFLFPVGLCLLAGFAYISGNPDTAIYGYLWLISTPLLVYLGVKLSPYFSVPTHFIQHARLNKVVVHPHPPF